MLRLTISLFVAGLLLRAQAPAQAKTDSVFDEIQSHVAELAKITGLAPLKRVQYDRIDRNGLKQFLEERIREEAQPEEIRVEELALKRFGLVPRDFDLRQATLDLLTEQAAAFYDYRKKKLFLLEEGDVKLPVGGEMGRQAQAMILVHELAHALADQHFDLGKYIRRGRNDDAALARMSVMEGQATWLMMEFLARKAGRSLRDVPQMVDMMGMAAGGAIEAQYPVLGKAPLYIRQSLMFPYTGGLRFQDAVIRNMGNAAFAEVFKRPPMSTAQVMHPELYLSRTEPVKATLPAGPRGGDWKTLTDGTMGEFDHAVLLEQYLSKKDAEELTPRLRGGSMALLENKRAGQVTLLYASEWSDEAAANRMFQAYRTVMKGKWKQMKVEQESATEVAGTSEDGPFLLRRDGRTVQSTEGWRNVK